MKKKSFLIIPIIFFINTFFYSQTIILPDNWIFKTGDDNSYKNETIDELQWTSIRVPGNWEDQGFPNYDGYAWYRLHFTVDEDLGNEQLYLFLGKIDDLDETFLNGVRIGSSGKFPPNPVTAWDEQRAYKIPNGLLKKNNVIAVRTYDIFSPGGIHSGLIGILNQQEYEYEMNPPMGPKKSFYQLPTANGLIAAVYNERRNEIENVFPHIFKFYDENKLVKPFVKSIKLNTKQKPISVKYLENSHIISIQYPNFSLKYFAPFSTNEKIFYAVLSGKKETILPLSFSYKTLENDVLVDSVFLKANNSFHKYFLFSFNDSLHNNSVGIKQAVSRIRDQKFDLVSEELNFMLKVFTKAHYPAGINFNEKNIYQQSIAILKMAQTTEKEVFPKSSGQILASLPPGVWSICWLRDGMYALLGLNSAGLFDEAKNLLSFYLNADANYYKTFIWKDGKDYGVGKDYQISVTRYFGIGKEESDFNDFGPNIELDGFGFFLYTFSDYINRSGDKQFFEQYYKFINEKVADVLIHCIDTNNVIRIDSGPWERHLPGKQYIYTSATAAAGLRVYAELLSKMGIESDNYSLAAEKIRNGIMQNFVVDGRYLKGNVEGKSPEEYEFYDMGMIEAFSLDVINDEAFFNSNLQEYDKKMKIQPYRGYSRVNGIDLYDISEWVMIDLRTASAHIKFEQKEKAKKLIDWITKHAHFNFNLIPELIDYTKETYEGAVPMVGFGAGTYIKTINDYYSK